MAHAFLVHCTRRTVSHGRLLSSLLRQWRELLLWLHWLIWPPFPPITAWFPQTTEGINTVIAVNDIAPKNYNLLRQRRELIQWLYCTDWYGSKKLQFSQTTGGITIVIALTDMVPYSIWRLRNYVVCSVHLSYQVRTVCLLPGPNSPVLLPPVSTPPPPPPSLLR